MAEHPIVHVEIPATNTKAASQFYADVFGWKITVDPSFDYHMFSAEGGPGGGFVDLSKGSDMPYKPGQLLVYIGTDDIEASLASVAAHGGKTVMPKTEIPNVGWWAIFTDPSGNQVALYKNAQG